MTTKKQKYAVLFCEEWLRVNFEGDINNFQEVNQFLTIYLDYAKSIAELACASYYSHFNY